ncbi:hypothetical protein [Streptomyces cadmiisoli]|uniref:Uncharacterized protein n=1 Tax=Streptomyces cadmiisoli TaxID=2184053 RepID=A0A2Z4IRT1_9ACTN|nr:hypothetical protein [Streptomyces cadmiisoli]AWW35410.1 hypothetical protein DN051_00830 [Streptomyces cadmiisoli]AWW42029.1 hypothetical protein DN051_39980 [Streptomyces cadmiisoli]
MTATRTVRPGVRSQRGNEGTACEGCGEGLDIDGRHRHARSVRTLSGQATALDCLTRGPGDEQTCRAAPGLTEQSVERAGRDGEAKQKARATTGASAAHSQ